MFFFLASTYGHKSTVVLAVEATFSHLLQFGLIQLVGQVAQINGGEVAPLQEIVQTVDCAQTSFLLESDKQT